VDGLKSAAEFSRYTKKYGDPMIIDAHAHACGDFLNGKDIIKILNRNNVDKVVLVPGELGSDKNYSLPELAAKFPNSDIVAITNLITKLVIGIAGVAKQIGEGNTYVYSLVKEYPDRIIQFYWVRLSQSNSLEDLEQHYTEYGFKGIKLHQCWESFKINSDKFHKISEWAASHDLPIFVHLFTKRQATQLAKYIKEHPNTIFIIGHLFGLERYLETGINSDNTFFEISSPQLVSIQRLMKAIQFFGAKRILMGSDTPYGLKNLELNITRVKDLRITDGEKCLILGDNMKKLLRI
jgi:predicted TIM-barrel fold metal-dependent hydrolase